MNCKIANEQIVMAGYEELADELLHELERHLAVCPDCRTQQEQLLALKAMADTLPVLEPEANLVARARLKLDEALDALPPQRWHERLLHRMTYSFASLLAAPVAAGLLLVAGVGAGTLGEYELTLHRAAPPAATQQAAQAQPAAATNTGGATEIASVSSIVRQPNSDQVEVRYNQVVPQRIEGSMNDPAIRQLLMVASQSASSTGVRDDSVGLLANECRQGRGCKQAGIRDALLVALRYDKNSGVREKALKGLEPYVAQDVLVRDAVLEAIMNDSDPRIRNAAINLLEPVEADTSVRQVLHTVADSDQNPYIRTVSRQVLDRVPEIQ